MAIEITVPALGESVTEATVGQWFKKPGDAVNVDEPLLELETDKVTLEVPAPAAGILADIKVPEGSSVAVGSVLGSINERASGRAATQLASESASARSVASPLSPTRLIETPPPAPKSPPTRLESSITRPPADARGDVPPAPAARKLMEEKGLSADDVHGSGRRGQILKEDVLVAALKPSSAEAAAKSAAASVPVPATQLRAPSVPNDAAREERVKMTRLRQTIARRLKDAQNTAAMLTTFNDVDMSAIMGVRNQYKDLFEKRHGVKLGFMGFFVKACIQALREVPAVNAEIDGQDIIYKNYYHIGVAVGTERGLVVPVVREADRMQLAEIEQAITDFGRRARDGYGSLLSTPILNAPQSGILGMHRIEERAVVRGGQIVARPMMSLALSYDHRIVDGKDAVTFLVRVKECLEDPRRFVLEL
jgi:2-oxoglutarate dehydrogenase E2 component (dihydrolipoamide succinyltransferase)